MKWCFKWDEFRYPDDNETLPDICGWVKQGNPVMQPASGQGIAHDCLEHSPRDTGSLKNAVAEELKAFGRMYYIRWEVGSEQLYDSQERVLVRELRSVWDYVENYCYEVPNVKPLKFSKDFPNQLKFFQRVVAELEDDFSPDPEYLECNGTSQWKLFLQAIPRLLMDGMKDAIRQWRGIYVYEYVWEPLVKCVDRVPKIQELGHELQLSINKKDRELKIKMLDLDRHCYFSDSWRF